jgi:hypothetical protein
MELPDGTTFPSVARAGLKNTFLQSEVALSPLFFLPFKGRIEVGMGLFLKRRIEVRIASKLMEWGGR